MTPQNARVQRALLGQVLADFPAAGIWVQESFPALIPDLIRRLPLNREPDVVWLDMTDPGRVPGINLVERMERNDDWLSTADLIDVMRTATQRLFGQSAWRQQDEAMLDNALLAVLQGQRQPTLLHLYQLLSDEDYRYDLTDQFSNPISRQYWRRLEPKKERELAELMTPSHQSLSAILSHPLSGRVFAQPRTTISLRQAFDRGKIVLISLPRRHLGEFRYTVVQALLDRAWPGRRRPRFSLNTTSVDIFVGSRAWRVTGDTVVEGETRVRFQAETMSAAGRWKWSALSLLPELAGLFQFPPSLDPDLELWQAQRGAPEALPEHPDQEMLRWVDMLGQLETDEARREWLKQLPEDDWPGYLAARRYHDAVRRNELIEYPEQIPDKIERVRLLNQLAYGTPHYETEVQVNRILDGG